MELREIITPTSNAYVLNLPDEMIGKKVEVIAHEVEEREEEIKKESLQQFFDSLADMRVDLTNFKFDRDEANNYDE